MYMPGQADTPQTSPDSPRHTLVKYLVSAGLGSRRHCAALVLSGFVHVNGTLAESLTMEVSRRDSVDVDGRPVAPTRTGHVYLMANKPDGHLSSVSDDRGRPTIIDLVPRALRMNGLVPAGRLDLHSTGLMLLTTDGELVNRVTHPRYEIEKEYYVELDKGVVPTASSRLKTGVEIDSGIARAKALRRLHDERGYRYSVTLNEGKKREVRLMFRAIGRQVLQLKRVRVGNLLIDGLEEGEIRELTDGELAGIRRMVGMQKTAGSGPPPSTRPPAARPRQGSGRPGSRAPRPQGARPGVARPSGARPAAGRPNRSGPPSSGQRASGQRRTDNRGRSR